MNRARIQIDGELLAKMLLFPEGSRILRVRQSDEVLFRTGGDEPVIEMIVEHEDLPALVPGAVLRITTPMYRTYFDDGKVEFQSWGCS